MRLVYVVWEEVCFSAVDGSQVLEHRMGEFYIFGKQKMSEESNKEECNKLVFFKKNLLKYS